MHTYMQSDRYDSLTTLNYCMYVCMYVDLCGDDAERLPRGVVSSIHDCLPAYAYNKRIR